MRLKIQFGYRSLIINLFNGYTNGIWFGKQISQYEYTGFAIIKFKSGFKTSKSWIEESE